MPRMREAVTPLMHRVLQVLSAAPVHLTAEEILQQVDDVGRATVYRALDRLSEEGIINRLSLESGTAVYEYTETPHMHFQCRVCGKLYDILVDPTELVTQAMVGSSHIIEKTDVTAYGTCKDCREAASRMNGGN